VTGERTPGFSVEDGLGVIRLLDRLAGMRRAAELYFTERFLTAAEAAAWD